MSLVTTYDDSHNEVSVMETLSASHHWSQLRALHPDLLQVTWSPHRVPAGLLTWVSAVRQITKGDIKTLSFISYHVLCFFLSLPPCRLQLSVRVHRWYLWGSDRSLLLQTELQRRELRLLRQRLRQLPRLLPWVTATDTLNKTVWASEFYVPKHSNPPCYVEIKSATLCVRQPSPRIPPTTTTARPNQQARSSVRLYFYFIFNFIYLGVASCCCFWILD